MLLLKAAVNVGSELQASSYSPNTECCGRFIFSKLYIFFLLPIGFHFESEYALPSDLNSTALLCEQILNS